MEFYEIQKYLIDQLSTQDDSKQILRSFLLHIQTKENEAAISRLNTLDFETDVDAIERTIGNIIELHPPKKKIKGYWFGIFETTEGYQAHLVGSNKASLNDEAAEWAVEPEYAPENRYIESNVLRILPQIESGTEDIAIRYFSLWYLLIAVSSFCKKSSQALLNSNKCIVTVGYDSGDFINVGQVTEKGFELIKLKIQKPKALKPSPNKHKYYAIESSMNNGWFISINDDSDLVSGFAAIEKPIDKKRLYTANATVGFNQYPLDYNEDAFANPIVSERLLEIFIKHVDQSDIEFVSIVINENPNLKYYILNVLKSNKCLNDKQTTWYMDHYAKDFVFDEVDIRTKTIFRLKSKDTHHYIYINSSIKQDVESNGITGMKLIPIGTKH